MNVDYTNMFEERLIEAVRKFPCLYDKTSKNYRKKYAKEKAWNAVATAIREPVDRCQCRWKSLRDRFVREQKISSSTGEESTWEFHELLQFLKGHVSTRNHRSVVNNQPKSEESYHSDSTETSISDTTFEPDMLSTPPTKQATEDSSQQWAGPFETENCTSSTKFSVTNSKRKRNAEEQLEDLIEAATNLVSSKAAEQQNRNSGFLKVLDEYLLKLPDQTQDYLKMNILSIVFKECNKHMK